MAAIRRAEENVSILSKFQLILQKLENWLCAESNRREK